MSYEPLTKKIIDDKGNPMVVCRLHGTDECHIHKPNGCNNCPMFQAILTQLNTFEEIYMEGDEKCEMN